jgi:acylphosphatase
MATGNGPSHVESKTATSSSKEESGSLVSCDFEIFGTVQGVFFRKYTQQQATKLKLVGWVKNTATDTVQGHIEGRKTDIDKMKNWLQTTGSPKSKITKANFSNEKSVTQLNGTSFSVSK